MLLLNVDMPTQCDESSRHKISENVEWLRGQNLEVSIRTAVPGMWRVTVGAAFIEVCADARWCDYGGMFGMFAASVFCSGIAAFCLHFSWPSKFNWWKWDVFAWSDQIRSVAQSCLTLWDPINRSTPGLPVHHPLPEFTETQVHGVSDAIQPSHPLSSPSPLAPNPSQHQSLFQWVNSSPEVVKVLEFQL